MEVALEEEYPEQAAKYRELLDQQSYTAAAALLSTLIPDLFHRGQTRTFLALFNRLPPAEQESDLELMCAAGDAWRLHNDWEAAVLCYQRAQHLAEARDDRAFLGRALSRRALVCWLRGDVEGALLFYRRAQEALPPAHDGDGTWKELRSGYALALSSLGQLNEAEQLLQDQLRDCQRCADTAGQCIMLHNLGMMIYLRRGDFQRAESVLREALHLAEKNQLRFCEAYVLNSLAYTLNWQCRPDESLGLSSRAQSIGEALGTPNIMAFACINRALSLLEQSDIEAAGLACEQARTLLRSTHSSPLSCDVLLVQAQLQQKQCPSRALDIAQTALATARLHHDQWMVGLCLLQLIEIELELREFEKVRDALVEALAVFEHYTDRYHTVRCHLLAARSAYVQEHWSELEQHLRPLMTDLNRYPFLASKTVHALTNLLPAIIRHDPESGASLIKPAATWGKAFAPLARAMLDDPRPQVRLWVVRVLAQHDDVWSWEILAEHKESLLSIRTVVQTALQRAQHHPLPDLELRCLGQLSVRQGGVLIANDRWVSLHAQIILVYLVLHGSATRDELIELLWPGEDPEKASSRLRSTIRLLRKALCPPWRSSTEYILYQNERYLLTPTIRVTSDGQQFRQMIWQARLAPENTRPYICKQALNFYGGEFLPGCYNDWVIEQREQFATEMLWAREEHTYWLLNNGRTAEAETEARAIIDVDPFRERAWRFLLRSLLQQQRTVEAVKVYQRLATLLHDELGIEPSPETRRLVADVLASH